MKKRINSTKFNEVKKIIEWHRKGFSAIDIVKLLEPVRKSKNKKKTDKGVTNDKKKK